MSQNNKKVTFQVTGMFPLAGQYVHAYSLLYIVARLSLSSPLPKQDVRVTIRVGDVSKLTCSGQLSEDDLTVTWNHPFLL